MKLGIMQPYFMPYIGYWQLLAAVDKYVIYDDVNFIKQGWVNRNRVLVNGKPGYINVPMLGASSNKKINEIGVNNDTRLIQKNLRMIENVYRKAPYYNEVRVLLEEIFNCGRDNLAGYLVNSIQTVCRYLGIGTELIVSSALEKDCNLKGQDKVLAICRLLGADEYYNAIGGMDLYSYSDFMKNGVKLSFLKTNSMPYKQFNHEFQDNLSVIDVMMFNPVEKIGQMLENYVLLQGEEKMLLSDERAVPYKAVGGL